MITADQELDIDSGLSNEMDSQEESFAGIIQGVNDWIKDSLKSQDATCAKCAKKINSYISRQSATQGNTIDALLTQILQWVDTNQVSQEWTLGQVAAKAGVINPGEGIATINWNYEPQAETCDVDRKILWLDCEKLAPCLAPLIEVLREIRDRMGYAPALIPGEPPAKAVADADVVSIFPSIPAVWVDEVKV
jgi:hypothetical protein